MAPAMPGIYVCVRETLDWRDAAAVDAQLNEEFRPKRALWDATFAMPYHVFRQRVKEIAQANLARLPGVTVAPLADVPAGAVIVPVDDDDWFAPGLAEHLARAYAPGLRGWSWPQRVLQARRPGTPLTRLLGRRPDPLRTDNSAFLCGSCCYAVVNEPPWAALVLRHGEASRHFETHPDAVRRLDPPLSLQNRNLSSQTVLGWRKPPIGRARLLRRYRRHRRFYARVALPPELLWAQPCVDAMGALMAELQPRSARRASQTAGDA